MSLIVFVISEFLLFPLLFPKPLIDIITYKAFKMLGFIKRIVDEFNLAVSLKSLYCASVRIIL